MNKKIDLDSVFEKKESLDLLNQVLRGSDDEFSSFSAENEVIKVTNLEKIYEEDKLKENKLINGQTNLPTNVIASAFGALGFFFQPISYLSQYYSCDEYTIGSLSTTFISKHNLKKKEKITFSTDELLIFTFKNYNINNDFLRKELVNKHLDDALIQKIVIQRDFSPSQAKKYIQSNIINLVNAGHIRGFKRTKNVFREELFNHVKSTWNNFIIKKYGDTVDQDLNNANSYVLYPPIKLQEELIAIAKTEIKQQVDEFYGLNVMFQSIKNEIFKPKNTNTKSLVNYDESKFLLKALIYVAYKVK